MVVETEADQHFLERWCRPGFLACVELDVEGPVAGDLPAVHGRPEVRIEVFRRGRPLASIPPRMDSEAGTFHETADRWRTRKQRCGVDDLEAAMAPALTADTMDVWMERLDAAGIPAGRQQRGLQPAHRWFGPAGTCQSVGPPPVGAVTAGRIRTAAGDQRLP